MSNTLVIEVFDAAGLRGLSERLSRGNAHRYRLRDPAAASCSTAALSRHVMRSAGHLQVIAIAERLGTAVGIVEPGIDAFCFSDLRSGAMALSPAGAAEPLVGGLGRGLVHGGEGGLTALTQDGTARTNLWVKRAWLESALEARLETLLREPLRFAPSIDWTSPGPAAVQRLLLHAEAEFARVDGMAAQPVALAAFTDLFVHTALLALPHNYMKQLLRPSSVAAPVHLRRAEMFMRERADAPIGLADIASAAGCSVRTLQNAFRMFRDTTPHRALHAAKLERARDDLHQGDGPVAAVARRYGFTNPTRFTTSYTRRFGERPRRK